jgi:hypothetical protein
MNCRCVKSVLIISEESNVRMNVPQTTMPMKPNVNAFLVLMSVVAALMLDQSTAKRVEIFEYIP